MRLSIRSVTQADLPLLAEMNKRLIEDEGSCNPMTIEELQQRMSKWLAEDWDVRLFIDDGKELIIGYAVYQFRSDDYHPETRIVYLRQLYLERVMRSQGITGIGTTYREGVLDN